MLQWNPIENIPRLLAPSWKRVNYIRGYMSRPEDLTIEEYSFLCDLQYDYEGELLQVFPTEYEIAQTLIDKGYITLDPDSDDYVWFVDLPEKHRLNQNKLNGKTVANFYTDEHKVIIEFDDGTEVKIIPILKSLVYDEEWGAYVDKAKLNIVIN